MYSVRHTYASRTLFTTVAGLAIAMTLPGCGDETGDGSVAGSAGGTTAAARPGWLLTSAPADAIPVGQAKANAAEGDEVVIRGRIGGRMVPVSEESPVFVIVDLALPHCGELPDDQCQTPWDYCCEPRDSLTANSATVQLVSADGSALAINPVAGGLEPLDEVIVVGTVGPRPDPQVLTIRATGVHRAGG